MNPDNFISVSDETAAEDTVVDYSTTKAKIILLYRCFSVVFIITGTVCNLLSAIIYSKKKMRQTSYSIYLFVLAVVDLSVTWVGNLRFMLMFFSVDLNEEAHSVHTRQDNFELYFSSGLDLRETSLVTCRIHRFLTYYLLQLSSCLLCMLSIDRFFGVVLVLKSSRYCTVYLAKRIIILTLFFLFLLNLHFLTSMGNYEATHEFDAILNETIETVKFRCEPNPANELYAKFWTIFIWIDSALYSVGPFFIMLFCNFLIINKIVRSRIQSKSIVMSQVRRYDALKMGNRLTKSMSIISLNVPLLPSEKRISIIFLIISFSFLLLTMPISLIESLPLIISNGKVSSLTIAICSMFMYMNHVINFFFYCALGPKFRNEVKKMFPFNLMPANKINPTAFSKSKTINGVFNKNDNIMSDMKKVSSYPLTLYKHHNYTLHKPHVYKTKEFFSPNLNPFITFKCALLDDGIQQTRL